MYIQGVQLNPDSNIPENNRPQHDCSVAFVVAHQYSSATLVSLPFQSRKVKIGVCLKKVITSILYFFLHLFNFEKA
jgi:hypothetical protein